MVQTFSLYPDCSYYEAGEQGVLLIYGYCHKLKNLIEWRTAKPAKIGACTWT